MVYCIDDDCGRKVFIFNMKSFSLAEEWFRNAAAEKLQKKLDMGMMMCKNHIC